MHPRLIVVSVLVPVLVIVAAVMGGRWAAGEVSADTRSSLTAALDSLPADTQVAGFTDWAGVRHELGLGSATTAAARAALTDDASLRDLTTRSVIGESTEEMHDAYGWSAADLDWETYGQASRGAAMVARLDRSESFGTVRARLVGLGYTQRGPVWTIGQETPVGPELTTTLAAIVLVPRQRLLIAAGDQAYASEVLRVVDHDAASLLSVRSAADVASALVGADSALLQAGAFSCRSTSLGSDDADVQAQARAVLDRAGSLARPVFTGRALDAGAGTTETMQFALGFRSPSVAARQLHVRTALASGPFIGGNGRIEDSLRLRGGAVRGSAATLRFHHVPGSTAYMTGDGPLLFAGC